MTEVLLLTQETCGACATQREKNEGIEDEFPDVQFREADIQQDLDTAEEFGVRKTPTTLVYAGDEQAVRSRTTTHRLHTRYTTALQNTRIMKSTRRQYLQLLTTAAVATAGAARTATAQQTPVVKMENNYFDPVGLYVESGTTVRFEISAGAHSATAYEDRIPSGASPFDSGTISEGSYEYTFETPGTYDYYCIPHRSLGMVGRIVVGQPGGPAEASAIPDGEVPASNDIVQQGSIAYDSGSNSDGDTTGSMMGSGMGPGMMNGGRGGWLYGLPLVGGALGLLALIGGGLYWGLSRTSGAQPDDSAMAILRSRYANGDIDEAEFQRRRERLQAEREE